MAERSSFFNSVSHDRRYSAEDWAAYFSSFISNGVFAKPSDGLQVMAAGGMTITIKAGSGFINGYYYRNTTDLKKTLVVADGVLHRIDRIVARWSLVDRAIYIAVKRGAPSSTPTAPSLQRDAEVYELALGDVYIGAGITAVTQSNITDRRANGNLCGFVTGVIDQFDFSTLCTQFEAFFSDYRTQIKEDYDSYSASMVDFESAAQADFNTWFDSIKYVLDGDTAGHLYNEISAVREEIGTVRDSANNIRTEQITNGAVTAEKIAAQSVSQVFKVTVPASRWVKDEATGWSQISGENMIAIEGVKETDNAEIDLQSTRVFSADRDALKSALALIDGAYTADGGIELYAEDKPEIDIPIKIMIFKR